MMAQETLIVKMEINKYANLCGDNQFVLIIKSNEVYYSDSLQGFEIDIRYNQDEINLNNIIYNGTLADQADFKQYDYTKLNSQPNTQLFIQASKFSGYLKGNLPFVIISGRYLNKCSQSSYIYLNSFNALYDFNVKRNEPIFQMFVDSIAYKDKPKINVINGNFNKRLININSSVKYDTLNYSVKSIGDNLRIDSLKQKIYLNKIENIKINNVWISENIEYKIDYNNDTCILYTNVKSNPNIDYSFNIQIENINSFSAVNSGDILVTTKLIGNCNCVNSINDDTVNINRSITNSIESDNILKNNDKLVSLNKYNYSKWFEYNKEYIEYIMDIYSNRYKLTNKENIDVITYIPDGLYFILDYRSSVIAKFIKY